MVDLYSMVHLIQTGCEDMYTYIKLFAHRLTMTPTPPPGRVAIVSNAATCRPTVPNYICNIVFETFLGFILIDKHI